MIRMLLPAFIGLFLLAGTPSSGRPIVFEEHFQDSTLRLDYVFAGDAAHQEIFLHKMARTPVWAGRRHHLEEPLLQGNGQIRVLDPESGACLYATSFSSLFQEWTVTPEARHTQKAFEAGFQVPFPRKAVNVEITLMDTRGQVSARMMHPLDPADILIRPVAHNGLVTMTVWQGGAPEEVVDVVIVSEGYGASEAAKFFQDAGRAADALFSHEPFASHKDCFAVRAVFAPSQQSGVSIPHEGAWRATAVSSHFDTFYVERYLTTSAIWEIEDIIGTVPYEHIIVLANTGIYGGGGIFNSLTIMNSDHPTFVPVLVHEFGHAFGGLADEYAYGSDGSDPTYPAGTEPWEPNITTLTDFASKWQDMMQQEGVGLFEGAGYELHGVYRPAQECRMRNNECKVFCPVCTRAIERMIDYYCR